MDPEKKARLEAAGFHVTNDPRDLLEPLEVINELRARVAELEGLVSRLEDAMTPEQLADFNRLNP